MVEKVEKCRIIPKKNFYFSPGKIVEVGVGRKVEKGRILPKKFSTLVPVK